MKNSKDRHHSFTFAQKPLLGFMLAVLLVAAPVFAQVTFFHTADVSHNWSLDLPELLRVIQFFNSGGYHAQQGTEDGYGPGPGAKSGQPHSSDYNPEDWAIDLSELLRSVQLFNHRGFMYSASGEDHYDVNPWHVPLQGDTDGDGLLDTEETALGMDPNNADEDGDGRPDGRALAEECANALFFDQSECLSLQEDSPLIGKLACPYCVHGNATLCGWTHPETGVMVGAGFFEFFRFCDWENCHDQECYDATRLFLLTEASLAFLQRGSFSYYEVWCSDGTLDRWDWNPALIHREDAVGLIQLLRSFKEGLES